MGVIFVARSAKLCKWAFDVGLSKHVFKVGYSDDDPKPLVEKGWAGETDWSLVKKRDAEGVDEDEILARLARKEKMVDPTYYPRLRGAKGVFKVPPEHVENHILVSRAMAGDNARIDLKLKPADFADYLIHNALK
ncbi:MAG TPA: hypothetical protein VGP50_03370 [Stellaceae bacterium]|jgi:hypothetical protein|nr:hypothetical protein [Stellaceae bacterium]